MRWLLELAIFALVAGPAAAQVNEAEKLFQSMENKLRTAKTLRCRFDSTLAGADQKVSLKGTLILGEGDKLRLEFDGKHDGDAVKVTLVSDGTNLSTRDSSERKKDKTEKAPKALGANARGTLSRMGVAIFWNGLIRGSNLRPDVLTVSGFKLGNKEKIGARNTQVIEYTVTEKKERHLPGQLAGEDVARRGDQSAGQAGRDDQGRRHHRHRRNLR